MVAQVPMASRLQTLAGLRVTMVVEAAAHTRRGQRIGEEEMARLGWQSWTGLPRVATCCLE